VRGLGLVSTQALADSPERKQGRYDMAAKVSENGVGVAADALTPKLSAHPRVQEIVRDVIMQQSRAGVIGALKAMAEREDSTSLLSLLKFAIVIVHGDADALIPFDRSREMKELIPHANFVELKGIGHMPMMEDTERTAKALKHLK
jgi:pimeloyl-ACP methyl ester carboxylesterase